VPEVNDGLPTLFDEEVLAVVARIPPRRAASYGDIAEMVGTGGPRQVGRTMSRYGGGVPWWRVVRADGTAAPDVAVEAQRRWAEEAMPRSADGTRIDWSRARWTRVSDGTGSTGA